MMSCLLLSPIHFIHTISLTTLKDVQDAGKKKKKKTQQKPNQLTNHKQNTHAALVLYAYTLGKSINEFSYKN